METQADRYMGASTLQERTGKEHAGCKWGDTNLWTEVCLASEVERATFKRSRRRFILHIAIPRR